SFFIENTLYRILLSSIGSFSSIILMFLMLFFGAPFLVVSSLFRTVCTSPTRFAVDTCFGISSRLSFFFFILKALIQSFLFLALLKFSSHFVYVFISFHEFQIIF